LVIIFKGQGKRISVQERNSWDPTIPVLFQPKAWVDGELLQKSWIPLLKKHCQDWLEAKNLPADAPFLHTMDNLK
jgi:hypothetical protein